MSKADAFGGGASRIAQELTESLVREGHVAHHWLSWAGSDHYIFKRQIYSGFSGHLARLIQKVFKRIGLPDLIPLELAHLNSSRLRFYDIVHFHDISGAISPWTIFWISRKKPVVWTFHDCSPLTAGCINPIGCDRFKRSCGGCPQLGEWPLDTSVDMTAFLSWCKRYVRAHAKMTVVAPSLWMKKMISEAGSTRSSPRVIANAVDTEIYRPRDRLGLRMKFHLPADRQVILLSASFVSDVKKGMKYAIEAIRSVADLNPFILIVGSPEGRLIEGLAGLDFFSAGYVGDRDLLAEYYAAADVFLCCSIADNMPLVVLETMACGVPTVGFATGGIPEEVAQGETGYLVPTADQAMLNAALREVLVTRKYDQWAENCRRRAVTLFSHRTFVDQHVSLYREILTSDGRKSND